ncbi:hypothetical protein [Allofournierella massiliensis]|uniref:Uncharacterized protein n=1 Tax=Allofournierella massiliensis TaxID=1650663 RepID=A0A4V2QBU6_9FIRM|nr:hypothetical protein [Fournierella massiliensis]TCL57832.1 hypothetical protein EDD77_109107 [Fournierella massiliensis]
MTYRSVLAALCAALLLSACSAPGNTPVAVSDPVSAAASTAGQIVEDYEFRFIDRTAEKIEEYKTYDPAEGQPTPALPRPEFLPTQDIAKKAGELCQSALGMDLSAQLIALCYMEDPNLSRTQSVVEVSVPIPSSEEIPLFQRAAEVFLCMDPVTGELFRYSLYPGQGCADPEQPQKDTWPELAQNFCTAAGLGQIQSTEFTDEGSAYQDWLWAVLENGDTALFQFSTGNTLTSFENVTATGGQARLDALHQKDAIDR